MASSFHDLSQGLTKLLDYILYILRAILIQILAVGPMPTHVAFIPDGNRRYERKHRLKRGEGHHQGLSSLITMIRYCREMGVACVSVYGFSIDNFKRKPDEVKLIMDLIRDNLEALASDASAANKLGVKVELIGNLDLLDEQIKEAGKRVAEATSKNSDLVLLVCLAYTSTDEITRGIRDTMRELMTRDAPLAEAKIGRIIDNKMYFSGYPDPDLLIRTSGETRLSNFLLWQTGASLLYAPRCLWPEISLRHLVWAVLEYQRNFSYLEKIKKKLRELKENN